MICFTSYTYLKLRQFSVNHRYIDFYHCTSCSSVRRIWKDNSIFCSHLWTALRLFQALILNVFPLMQLNFSGFSVSGETENLPALTLDYQPLFRKWARFYRTGVSPTYEQSETKKDINVVNRALSSFLLILVIQRQAKLNSASPIEATQFSWSKWKLDHVPFTDRSFQANRVRFHCWLKSWEMLLLNDICNRGPSSCWMS